MPRVVFVYADRVGAEMGGMGIRAVEFARAMSAHADVAVAAAATDGADLGVPVSVFDPHAPDALAAAVARADMVVAQPQWPTAMRVLQRSGAQLVFDLYDPEVFGTLEHFAGRPAVLRRAMAALAQDRLDNALRLGDRLICGSERQRDLWLGSMLARGLLTEAAYRHDPSFRAVLDTVPFGVSSEPPGAAAGTGPRRLLGIDPDAEVVLWNGGIWSWFDAPGAIRAMALVRDRRPNAVLVFMGASSAAPARRATAEARRLAGEGVIFHDEWVPYDERGRWLLEADCGLSAHLDHLEARYAHRTRLLDCMWAGLPIVCTSGDELAERVERDQLGATAPPGDTGALADAIESVLARGRRAFAARLYEAAAEHEWNRVIAPLVRWLGESAPPREAPAPRHPGELLRTAAYEASRAARVPLPKVG